MLRQLLLGLVVLGAAAPAYGQEVKLRWKFKEGEKFYVEDVQTTKTDVSVLGQQIKEEAKTTTVTSYTIKKVTADSVVIVQKVEYADVKSQGGLGVGDAHAGRDHRDRELGMPAGLVQRRAGAWGPTESN